MILYVRYVYEMDPGWLLTDPFYGTIEVRIIFCIKHFNLKKCVVCYV